MSSDTDYLMGVTNAKFERLNLQAAHLEPVTRRLIKQSGIGPGMHVIEVGCGLPSPDAGERLVLLLEDAGLPVPKLFWECIVGGSEALVGSQATATELEMVVVAAVEGEEALRVTR